MNDIRLALAAGGTGGHIFPALSVALEWRERHPRWPLLWIGTTRSREQELCGRNNIPLVTINVQGVTRKASMETLVALIRFAVACLSVRRILANRRINAVLAFGGYVSAPVVVAARLAGIPYYLQEQNTVPGLVNRLFCPKAACMFLGFPLNGVTPRGTVKITGTPVRKVAEDYSGYRYPDGFDRKQKTVLICGGSQGALSMNRHLAGPACEWLNDGYQVVWQTGGAGFAEVKERLRGFRNAFVFDTVDDLYPYYAATRVVVGRAGASTLSEIAYFGLPCVLVPLPWAADNHQWKNAGLAQGQGWGVRVRQEAGCGAAVGAAVGRILTDDAHFERMSRKALEQTPAGASAAIVTAITDSIQA